MPLLSQEEFEKTKSSSNSKPPLKFKEPERQSDGKIRTFEYVVEATSEWRDVDTKYGESKVIEVKVRESEIADFVGKEHTVWISVRKNEKTDEIAYSPAALFSGLQRISFDKSKRARITNLGQVQGKRYNSYSVLAV